MVRTKLAESTREVLVTFEVKQLELLSDFMAKTGEKNRSRMIRRILSNYLGRQWYAEVWQNEDDGTIHAVPAGTKKPSKTEIEKLGLGKRKLLGIIDLHMYGMPYRDFETLLNIGFLPRKCLVDILANQEAQLKEETKRRKR